MSARFTVELRGTGGWECWDNRPKPPRLVTSSHARHFCEKAKERLEVELHNARIDKATPRTWRDFYRVDT